MTVVMLQELFKSTVDLADLVGLHLVMSQIAGKGQLKFMIAGVGWASAELIMTGYVEYLRLFVVMIASENFVCDFTLSIYVVSCFFCFCCFFFKF